MDPQIKTRVSYTDEDGKERIISILPEQMPFYEKWRKTKEEIENGRWKGENRQKAYECMEKCLKRFTYQVSKDLPMKCECGIIVNTCVIARHRATNKHAKMMQALEESKKPKPPPSPIAETDKLCECGKIVSKANYARHIQGNQHSKLMLLINQ